jgi:hypothetical protein
MRHLPYLFRVAFRLWSTFFSLSRFCKPVMALLVLQPSGTMSRPAENNGRDPLGQFLAEAKKNQLKIERLGEKGSVTLTDPF